MWVRMQKWLEESQQGQSMVEYALIFSVLLVGIFAVFGSGVATEVKEIYQYIVAVIQAAI